MPDQFTARVVTANHYRVPPWAPRESKAVALYTAANADWFGNQELTEQAESSYLHKVEPLGTLKTWSDKSNITISGRSDKYVPLWNATYSVKADDRDRYHQAVKLRNIATGVEFLAVNCHMSNGSRWAAVRSSHAKAIVATLTKLQAEGIIDPWTPVVMTGDFNDSRRANQAGSPAAIFKAWGLVDSRDVIGVTSRIDLIYGRNVKFSAWSTIRTGIVSDHDWVEVTMTIPAVPQVTMWVRPLGDPIWKAEPFEVTARDRSGVFTKTIRQAGAKLVGVGTILKVDGKSDAFFKVGTDEYYRLSYLTAIDPAAIPEPVPVDPTPLSPEVAP